MANYKFNKTYQDVDAEDIWKRLVDNTQVDTGFQSVSRTPKIYKIESVNTKIISFSGDDRKV